MWWGNAIENIWGTTLYFAIDCSHSLRTRNNLIVIHATPHNFQMLQFGVFVRKEFVERMRYGIKIFWWRIHQERPRMEAIANYFHLKLEINKIKDSLHRPHSSITFKLFHYGVILCIVCTIVVRICRARNKWILVSVMRHSCDSSTTDHSDWCEHNKKLLPHSVYRTHSPNLRLIHLFERARFCWNIRFSDVSRLLFYCFLVRSFNLTPISLVFLHCSLVTWMKNVHRFRSNDCAQLKSKLWFVEQQRPFQVLLIFIYVFICKR